MKTITELFGHKPNVYVPEKKILAPSGVDPTLLYGVELEIEGLDEEKEDRMRRCVPGVAYHDDGSLRNNGGEYVTAPMNFATLEYVLDQFFHKNKLTDANYSERCSVHVHVNCCDLTLDQIRLILCLYQITERVLFNFIKADRKNNIFCVPWSESVIGAKVLSSENSLFTVLRRNNWHKYSALNLLPIHSQGTIEFRHMEGTKDLNYILNWCNIIGSMFKYARENKYQDVIDSLLKLNTTSAYATFMQNIFQGELYDMLVTPDFREALEEGVLNMKFMLVEEKKAAGAGYEDDVAGVRVLPNFPPLANVNPYEAEIIRLQNLIVAPDLEGPREALILRAIQQRNEWNAVNHVQPDAAAVMQAWNPMPPININDMWADARAQVNGAAVPARPIPRRPINRNPR
jgi:hypothetical protein